MTNAGTACRLPITEKLLRRNFTPEALNRVWASEITLTRADEGWLFLVKAIDLFSRHVVGWGLPGDIQAIGTTNALRMAWFCRRPEAGPVFYLNWRGQYCSPEFQAAPRSRPMAHGIQRQGNRPYLCSICFLPVASYLRAVNARG